MTMTDNRLRRTLASVILALIFCMTGITPALAASSPKLLSSGSKALYAAGSGTTADPYHIQTVEQFSNIRKNLGASYVLDNDLDFAAVKNWTPIGLFVPESMEEMESGAEKYGFHGKLDGRGHTIRNFTPDSCGAKTVLLTGLFAVLSGEGCIHDLALTGVSLTGVMMVGGLAGYMGGSSVLENVHLTGYNNIAGFTNVGGLVGGSNGETVFRHCSAQAVITMLMTTLKVKGAIAAGVLNGGAEGSSFYDCHVYNSIVTGIGREENSIGGLTGSLFDSPIVEGCSVENTVINVKNAYMVGGLTGMAGATAGLTDLSKRTVIRNCAVKNVTINVGNGGERVGMISGGGYFTQQYRNSRSEAVPEPPASYIENCTAEGTINGGKFVGSILGYQGRNSGVSGCTANVTWNGAPLTNQVGADIATTSLDLLA